MVRSRKNNLSCCCGVMIFSKDTFTKSLFVFEKRKNFAVFLDISVGDLQKKNFELKKLRSFRLTISKIFLDIIHLCSRNFMVIKFQLVSRMGTGMAQEKKRCSSSSSSSSSSCLPCMVAGVLEKVSFPCLTVGERYLPQKRQYMRCKTRKAPGTHISCYKVRK